jgi:single-strand DNA-binding protein
MDNDVEIVGRVGNFPELTFLGEKRAPFCELRVANTERRRNPNTDEWEDGDTVWVSVKHWNRNAEQASLVPKGAKVRCIGRLVEEEWEAADGTPRKQIKIVARRPPCLEIDSAQVESGEGWVTIKWGEARTDRPATPQSKVGGTGFNLRDMYPTEEPEPF